MLHRSIPPLQGAHRLASRFRNFQYNPTIQIATRAAVVGCCLAKIKARSKPRMGLFTLRQYAPHVRDCPASGARGQHALACRAASRRGMRTRAIEAGDASRHLQWKCNAVISCGIARDRPE